MSDARGLLDRISAFRQRLESSPQVVPESVQQSSPIVPSVISEPEAFRQTLRQIAGVIPPNEGPPAPLLTARAQRSLQTARELLERQRKHAADPLVVGLATDPNPDPLVAYHKETVAVMESAVRFAQVFPDSPTTQLKLCDGLDGVLEMVRERLTVQERAIARRRTDLERIDKLALMYAGMSWMQRVDLTPMATLAEELLEDARRTRPIRFLTAAVFSSSSYPGGPEVPAPARFLAAHALTVAQVIARIAHHDYEWAGRPIIPVAAALLMDCGMMRMPVDVLAKNGPLMPEERRVVESHPQAGAELVLRYIADGAPIAEGIATHHERADGTGYPLGLKGSTVPSLGRLLAVADVYAALCCPRSHRPEQDTRTALTDVLLMAEHGQLDSDIAEYLVHLAFYPVGSVVELTDGRIGVVAANHPNRLDPRSPTRPVIAVLSETDGSLLPRPEHLDLCASDRGGIVRTLPADRRRAMLGARYPELV